jgi:hypothetical protein
VFVNQGAVFNLLGGWVYAGHISPRLKFFMNAFLKQGEAFFWMLKRRIRFFSHFSDCMVALPLQVVGSAWQFERKFLLATMIK